MYILKHNNNLEYYERHADLKRKENVLTELREDYSITYPDGYKVIREYIKNK